MTILTRFLAPGILAGWCLGALESFLVAASTGLTFDQPLRDTLEVSLQSGALGGLLSLLFFCFPRPLRPTAPLHCFAWVSGLLLFTVGSGWIHIRLFVGISPWQWVPLASNLLAGFLCFLLARWISRKDEFLRAALLIAFVGHLGAWISSGRDAEVSQVAAHSAVANAPNVLVLLVDTLRADHLSCYGYEQKTSPRLDAFADQSIRFNQAYAQATWTRPSVASLMTSLYPASHRTNKLEVRIPESLTTMAEMFAAGGYETAGFSANRNVSRIFGFAQGFHSFWSRGSEERNTMLRFTVMDKVRDLFAKRTGQGRKKSATPETRADILNQEVLRWADARKAGAPWFAYVQYIDPHGPYAPPQEFLDELGVPLVAKEVLRSIGDVGKEPPWPFGSRDPVDPDLLAQVIRLYDAEIQYCDREIGRLLDALEQRGLLENTWIVITSDHGEEFFEHQQFGHGQSGFDELARIPLLVSGPGLKPGISNQPVELVDLLPTMAVWAGQSISFPVHGSPIPSLLGAAETPGKSAFLQNIKGHRLDAMIQDGYKIVRVLYQEEERWLLYDLGSDPGETKNLAATQPDRLASLQAALRMSVTVAAQLRVDQIDTVAIQGDVRQDLYSLGYIGDEEEEE